MIALDYQFDDMIETGIILKHVIAEWWDGLHYIKLEARWDAIVNNLIRLSYVENIHDLIWL